MQIYLANCGVELPITRLEIPCSKEELGTTVTSSFEFTQIYKYLFLMYNNFILNDKN